MASEHERLAAAARAAVERLFARARLRLGVVRDLGKDKRIGVTVDPDLTLPGLFVSAAIEHGLEARPGATEEVRRSAAGFLKAQEEAAKAAVSRIVHHVTKGGREGITASAREDLEAALGTVFDRTGDAVERIVDTEATAARNLAGVEAIGALNAGAGVEDPVVFFVVVRDDKLCGECRSLHLLDDGVTPRVWRMSEVSRTYHERGEDRPSILGEHPRCFVGDTRLATDRGLLTVKDLFDQGGPVQVAVDERVRNRKKQMGRSLAPWPDRPGVTWLDRHKEGSRMMAASHVFDTGVRACVRVTLSTGIVLEVSEDHEMWIDDDLAGHRVRAADLKSGQKVPLLSGPGGWGTDSFPELAELMGNLMGDGCIGDVASWHFFGDDTPYGERLLELARPFCGKNPRERLTVNPPNDKYSVSQATFSSKVLARKFVIEFGLSKKPRRVPARLWGATRETVAAFLRGLYAADGHSEGDGSKVAICLSQNDLEFLKEIQILLSNFGFRARMYTHGTEVHTVPIRYADGSVHDTVRKPAWRLLIGGWKQVNDFAQQVGMGVPVKQQHLIERLKSSSRPTLGGAWRTARVESVVQIGDRQTYCLTEPMTNTVSANGVVVGQCRCMYTTLLPGFGFGSGGEVKYVAPGYLELEKQRGG